MLGKKSSQNSAKTRFLYSHEYRDQEMGGKKRVKQFFQKHMNSAIKKVKEKNRLRKLGKHVFYIHTNIVNKKWGEKSAKQFFPKNTNSASNKCWDKKSS